MLITNLILFIISCIVLVLSGSWLVRFLSKISSFLRLSEFTVAFIIMAFSTTLPELFVGITSAIEKTPILSLGNVIGSNIVDLTLVAGIAILLARNINIKRKEIKTNSSAMFLISLVPMVLILIGNTLSRVDGIILITIFLIYYYSLIKKRKKFRKKVKNKIKRLDAILTTVFFILGLIILFISADFVVKYATLISIELFLPPIIIGLFLIAIGTSLPELAFGMKAATSGHSEMALGDFMGAVIANSTLVLGVTSLIYPIQLITFSQFLLSAIFMVIVTFIFFIFIRTHDKLDMKEGVILILIYIVFIIIELMLKSLIT
jgi:cation:H+ antiporter